MALARRGTQRIAASIWPGFVDVITALVLVLFFVLSIFMIVQFVLRDTIAGQEGEIDSLAREIAGLADALGMAEAETARQEELVATLASELETAESEITDYEAQVASLIARNTNLSDELETAESALSASEEAAQQAATRERALQTLVASLEQEAAAREGALSAREAELAETAEALDEAEVQRLAEAAAAQLLRERLEAADAELTALTLGLEEEWARAEETLTLLAAAEAARDELAETEEEALSEAERQAALRAQAEEVLAEEEEISAEARREVALLNQQTAELRRQLDAIQGLLAEAEGAEAAAEAQIENLGSELNEALARLAQEERARAELEARERERLEAEAQDLARYRSEFFGRMQDILGDRQGVEVVGDRFVFQSEVLFSPGSATLGAAGRAEVGRVAEVIREIADEIPEEIDWVLRVDGHTDQVPVSPTSPFDNNWELSQARALSVVEYMIEEEGIPPDRLAATGFGEFQPITTGTSPGDLALNRRIELKFTER
jgi:chemotaxis protein MotB